MGYKKIDRTISFADLILKDSMDKNQCLIRLMDIASSIDWTNYLPYCTVYSRHTKQPVEKVYADKGYAGKPNRDFLATNKIADGIMRKDPTTAK